MLFSDVYILIRQVTVIKLKHSTVDCRVICAKVVGATSSGGFLVLNGGQVLAITIQRAFVLKQ